MSARGSTPGPELRLALAAAVAGHHEPREAGRRRAERVRGRLTTALAVVATGVATYNGLLLALTA